MRTRTLQRRAKLSTIGVEAWQSTDGQGAPSWAASQDVEGWVREEDEFILGPDGTEERTTLKLWVPGDESPLPGEKDRVTVDGVTYTVRKTKTVKVLNGDVDHVKAWCREEKSG